MPKPTRTPTQKPKIKTEWNLGLLYASEKDPRIEKDIRDTVALYERFEKKYKDKTDYLNDESALLKALKDYEELLGTPGEKALYYFYYRKDLNADDAVAEAKMNKLSLDFAELGNKIVFFGVALSKISKEKQEGFLKSKKLEKYRYYLKIRFEHGKHTLSEAEEKIMNLKSLPARGMWTSYAEKLENVQTVKFKGKDLPLPQAMNMVPTLGTVDRRKLHSMIVGKLRSISHFAEGEINAVYTDKKINDGLRGYKEPYSATILGYENDEKTVLNLVETVTKHFDISRRFYKLKAKLLGVPNLEYADRGAKIGSTAKKISFEESYSTIREVFGKSDKAFEDILVSFLERGQIDVFPKKGKTGGAYCSGSTVAPTFMLLNHVSDLRSLTTFAHEMGHAIHTELSKSQPVLYRDYTMSAAETASTFFESLVFEDMFEKLPEKDRIVALHDRINDDIATIFRQIACFNFEVDLHRAIRKKGSISKEEIAELMNKHMKAYIGPVMKFADTDGFFFVSWSHIRRFFYVYSYAYGQIISKAMLRKYKADPAYVNKIKKFLSAGGSMSPDDIFKSIGIDTHDPKFFEEGLKQIEEDIKRLEKLTAKKK